MLKFDWNIVFVFINLIVFYLLMRKFLFGRIKKVMDARKELIAGQIKEAEDKNADADNKLAEYEEKLAAAEDEGARIIAAAKDKAQSEYNRIVADAQADTEQMKAAARAEIEAENANAKLAAREEIASLAIQAAEKLVGKNVSAETDSAIFDEFLNEGKTNE